MKSCHAVAFFLFISRFPSVEHRPGGIYLSGQSSNPANRRHLRIDPSARLGRSFSEFRTCCVEQSCASSIRKSSRTENCTACSKTRDLGGQSTSIKAVSLRRRPQIVPRSWLRLFRHDLLRFRRGWFDRHADEFNRVSQLWRARSWQMDHDLRTRGSHLRRHCRVATRYNAI